MCNGCLRERHIRYLVFEFRSLWYVCPVHGSQITDEWLTERGYTAIT